MFHSSSRRAAFAWLLICAGAITAQDRNAADALSALIEAERAFAKLSVEKGVRASFLAFFADDGVNFQPGPVRTKEAFGKRPAPAAPPPFTLNWAPVWGAISAAGDMGFNTGPFTVTDNTPQRRPPQHGLFFSVWKKQPDGSWKVAVDIGVNTPEAAAPLDAPFQRVGNAAAGKAKTVEAATLQTCEQEFHQAVWKKARARLI